MNEVVGFSALIDALYLEKVVEAASMAPEEKFLLGEQLFEYACSITLAGIRNQNPEWNELQCDQELARRLQLQEHLESLK